MPNLRIKEAAAVLGVSDDTVRRWVSAGVLPVHTERGRQVVDGAELARVARERVHVEKGRASARNRMAGIVTRVQVDGVMAQVDLAAGPFRLVSLMSREAVEELGLEPGDLATAVVKATMVVIEKESR